MGAEWDTKTAGRVKLTVYAGGTQGSEEATIRMMRPGVDQLQSNLLMAPGLATIDDAFNVFGVPFFFQSDAEGQYVLEKLTPLLREAARGQGLQAAGLGQRRLGAVVLEEAADLARRHQGRQALHQPGRRPHGAVVQGQRLQPQGAHRRRHPRAAQAHHRNDRRRAQSAVSRAAAPDLPGREVHARRPLRAALWSAGHHQRRLEQDRAQRSADRAGRGQDRREATARRRADARCRIHRGQ